MYSVTKYLCRENDTRPQYLGIIIQPEPVHCEAVHHVHKAYSLLVEDGHGGLARPLI